MAVPAQALKKLRWWPEAVAAFQPAADASPFGAGMPAAQLVDGCTLWEFRLREQWALIALQMCGNSAHIQATVSIGEGPLQMRMVFDAIEQTARDHGAKVLTLCTAHPEIAQGAGRWGASITGAVVSKNLEV
jgi:hypothetical protein